MKFEGYKDLIATSEKLWFKYVPGRHTQKNWGSTGTSLVDALI